MRTNDKRRNSWLLQLTPPRGGELPSWISSMMYLNLQLTPPRGGERVNIRFWTRLQILQLPPRAGGEHWGTVSIPGIAKLQLTPPEWGANSGPSSQRCQQPVFNSRHRVGQTA